MRMRKRSRSSGRRRHEPIFSSNDYSKTNLDYFDNNLIQISNEKNIYICNLDENIKTCKEQRSLYHVGVKKVKKKSCIGKAFV